MNTYNAGDITAKMLFESSVSDAYDKIKEDNRQDTMTLSDSDYIPLLAGMIADIAEDVGDDYSEWLGVDEVLSIANKAIENDSIWENLENFLREEIENAIIEIRGLPRRKLR